MATRTEFGGGKVAYEISPELRARVLQAVEEVRRDPSDEGNVGELVDVVVELTDCGLEYFFLYPLEQAAVGLVTRKGVELALGATGRTLPPVVRRTVRSLTEEQLLHIAEFIEHMLVPPGPD